MTKTQRLRDILKEQHIDWEEYGDNSTIYFFNGIKNLAIEDEYGLRVTHYLSPELATTKVGLTFDEHNKIEDAVCDAMDYARERAIELGDAAVPHWNSKEYTGRIFDVLYK